MLNISGYGISWCWIDKAGNESWIKNHQKKNFWKNLNKSLYLSTRPLNITYWKSKQLDYNQNNTDGDPGTADVEPDDAANIQASVSQCTPTNCKYDNDKYKLECAEYKGLVHCGCTSLPTYQFQLFLTKGYLPKIHMLQMRLNTFIPICHIFKSKRSSPLNCY